MTMDRVYQQHGFQQTQPQTQPQTSQSPMQSAHPTLHQASQSLTQSIHQQQQQQQQQHLYRQHHQHHHHQHHSSHVVLQQQQQHHHPNHLQHQQQLYSQQPHLHPINGPPIGHPPAHDIHNATPIRHRPVHPPPPPPLSMRQHQRIPENTPSSNHDNVITNDTRPTTSTRSLRNSIHDQIDCSHTSNDSPQPTTYHTNAYQPNNSSHHLLQPYYQPSSHIYYKQQQQQPINGHNYTAAAQIVDAPVADTDDNDNYNNNLEEVIQAILTAKGALEKPIEERDSRDITLIDNLCSLVHGFDSFPKTVRRALAAQAVLIVIEEKGKELIVHDEELDSFCVLIFGECEHLDTSNVPVRYYTVGDAFGVCEPTKETIRSVGHIMTKCENCAFLCVKKDDFYLILTDDANYPVKDVIRHRDKNGHIICVSQFQSDKKSSDPLWSSHLQSNNPMKVVLPDGHVIVKATEACLITALVDGYDRVDQDYVDDYLLLFRVFMTYSIREREKGLPPGMMKLCSTLIDWLDHQNYRDRVVKLVLTWLSSYYHDFELNADFSFLFFKILESRLLNLCMNNQLHLLHATLSTKSKTRQVTISRSSRNQPLTFSIAGGYDKNCGIFVTHVEGLSTEETLFNNLSINPRYLNNLSGSLNGYPSIQPRHRSGHAGFAHESKTVELARPATQLKPGDQILEVNGTNFAAIELEKAEAKLNMSTHLSLTVKYNPSGFHEMNALPENRRKSSLSSVSSVSPYQPSSTANKFTFNQQDPLISRQGDQMPPASPLFSSNANFGFKSIIKGAPKNEWSKLATFKQVFKHIRDGTVQSSFNNMETMSKISDNISDDQSNDIDIGKSKSNPDLPSMRVKDKQIESGLSNVVRLDDLNPNLITENQAGAARAPVNVLRVFNAANNDSRYLVVHEETTAQGVVSIAVKEFNLDRPSVSNPSPGERPISSRNWQLYEVSVVPESKTIKQKCLSEQTSRLAERASLCSRLYIKNNSQSSLGPTRLDMADDSLVNEILKESSANVTLTSLNATLLAVELTLVDFDKFRAIEPQQFVYDTFFNYSERNNPSRAANGECLSADTLSLRSSSSDGQDVDILQTLNKTRIIPKSWMKEYQEFADISNKEMFWVVCEILNERSISRRVKIVKQFVRVADVCSQLRNYNSMFAIISGLGHSCIMRLKRTFDKLKPKYKNQLEKMRSLFDPSRNMLNYRTCLNETPPPAIPLFPQIKKDLTFTKEGRSIFIRESNDASDDDDLTYPTDTVKRRSRVDLLSVKSSAVTEPTPGATQARPISYNSFNHRTINGSDDSILVNFAEIRQFTDRVRNVIKFSSIPYSNDLLTNTKDSQRNQAQIKKMHEEWQMRKRIRHYIHETLDSAIIPNGSDQLDSVSTKTISSKLDITYDERTLHQRSLEVEPELNTTRQTTQSVSTATLERHPSTNVQLQNPNQPILPPVALNAMHPPSVASNSSPTLSKSSSLSSCSSFNHHLPNYHVQRNSLTSAVGKFGTESTESLRKLQALSENVEDWRLYNGSNNGSNKGGDHAKIKGLVSSMIFPPKANR